MFAKVWNNCMSLPGPHLSSWQSNVSLANANGPFAAADVLSFRQFVLVITTTCTQMESLPHVLDCRTIGGMPL